MDPAISRPPKVSPAAFEQAIQPPEKRFQCPGVRPMKVRARLLSQAGPSPSSTSGASHRIELFESTEGTFLATVWQWVDGAGAPIAILHDTSLDRLHSRVGELDPIGPHLCQEVDNPIADLRKSRQHAETLDARFQAVRRDLHSTVRCVFGEPPQSTNLEEEQYSNDCQ